MLKNNIVSKVEYNSDKKLCIVKLQNGDTLCREDTADLDQVRAYIKVLEEEDELVFPPEALDLLSVPEKLLRIQCFGAFEVFYHNIPVHSERKGAKEILAFLIDKRGASSNRVEICNSLWEDEDLIDRRKAYFRTLILSLRNTLKKYNAEEVFITHRDDFAINTSLLDCDYYRFLNGDSDKSVQFRGEYMSQYSWGEYTLGQLIEETNIGYN